MCNKLGIVVEDLRVLGDDAYIRIASHWHGRLIAKNFADIMEDEFGMILNAEKTKIFAPAVQTEFLGYKFQGYRLSLVRDKLLHFMILPERSNFDAIKSC